MIYTTLKQNREMDTKFVYYCDEYLTPIGGIFGDEYLDENDYSDWDKLEEDFTEKQIESKVLKYLKEDAKDKEDGCVYKLGKFLIDRFFAYDDLEELLKKGLIGKEDLFKVEKDQKKFNFEVKKDIRDENGNWEYHYIDDLIEQYFPSEEEDEWVEFEAWIDDVSILGYTNTRYVDDDEPIDFYGYDGLECGSQISKTKYLSFTGDQLMKWEVLAEWFKTTDVFGHLVEYGDKEKILKFRTESDWGRMFDVELYINCSKLGGE